MIPLKITPANEPGVTILSNQFIDQYMTEANEAQIKIYLYLLRMVSANLPTDISELAEHFNHTEKEVVRSLKYWDKKNLLSLEWDDAGNITGIRFLSGNDLGKQDKAPFVTPETKLETNSEEATIPVTGKSSGKMIPMHMDYEAEKNKYTGQKLMELAKDSNVSMIRMLAEQYYARPLNPGELKSLCFVYDRLSFSVDLIDYLMQYCVENGQTQFGYLEQVATCWFEKGITTEKEAKASISSQDRNESEILSFFGKTGKAAPKELEFIHRWTHTFGFPLPIIQEACNRAVLAVDNNRFAYANSILESWFQLGVRTKADIQKADKAFEERKKNYTNSSGNSGNNNRRTSAFNNIESLPYDLDALEKALTQ